MHWKKLTQVEISERVKAALDKNINYRKGLLLGVPATYLDNEIFYDNAPFLEDAPFLQTLIANPNHIGCHTMEEVESLPYFSGTQEIERELLTVCAQEIFKAEPNQFDGYVSQGGTEANIQAMWVYRNYFMSEMGVSANEIGLVYSEDSHYSMPKGANILGLHSMVIDVDDASHQMDLNQLQTKLMEAKKQGVKCFIVVQNMATTMFGSIDDVSKTANVFIEDNLPFKLHVDAAFGGFIVPFADNSDELSFKNPHISSFTLDGHKMLQTPYGTGIFLIRKNFMKYVKTEEAKYVNGTDFTLSGSRSGAISVALWMSLMVHGNIGWQAIVEKLLDRSSFLCNKLDQMGVQYFRDPRVNIITIKSECISKELALKYGLVADDADGEAKWWKIVVMQHVKQDIIEKFVKELKSEQVSSESTH